MPSGVKCAPFAGVPGIGEGIARLLVLTEGVMKGVMAGVWSDEFVPERALSLLRERFDDEGEGGTGAEAEAMMSVAGSCLVRTPVSLALRLRARSLCSLKKLLLLAGRDSGDGRGGTAKLGDGIVAGGRARGGCRQAGSGVQAAE